MSTPVTKEVVEQIIKYMKKDRCVSLVDKCKKIGITPKSYYAMCKKFDLDGKLGTRVPRMNATKILKLIAEDDSDSDQYTQAQDSLE